MDITQKRQVGEDQRVFVNAVQWDQGTPIELLGTGSQQAQLYPSDIDLFSAVKDVSKSNPAEMYRKIQAVFDRAEDAGDMFFIEFKLQNVDGSKQKWYDTDFDEGEFVAAANNVDFLKVDYVIFMRGTNLFTELSSIYSFSPMPAIRTLTQKIGADFAFYYKEGKVYKSLKRMYSIYKLQGKKEKLVQLSKLFNSSTGFKYSLSSNLKAIELLLEHYNDHSIQNLVRANLKNLENTIGVKIRSSAQMQTVIQALDAQIEKETQAWLSQGNKSVLGKKKGGKRELNPGEEMAVYRTLKPLNPEELARMRQIHGDAVVRRLQEEHQARLAAMTPEARAALLAEWDAESDEDDGLEGEGRPLTYAEWEAKYAALLAQKKRAIEAREKKKAERAIEARKRKKAEREKKKAEKDVPPLETPMRTSRVIKATPPKETEREIRVKDIVRRRYDGETYYANRYLDKFDAYGIVKGKVMLIGTVGDYNSLDKFDKPRPVAKNVRFYDDNFRNPQPIAILNDLQEGKGEAAAPKKAAPKKAAPKKAAPAPPKKELTAQEKSRLAQLEKHLAQMNSARDSGFEMDEDDRDMIESQIRKLKGGNAEPLVAPTPPPPPPPPRKELPPHYLDPMTDDQKEELRKQSKILTDRRKIEEFYRDATPEEIERFEVNLLRDQRAAAVFADVDRGKYGVDARKVLNEIRNRMSGSRNFLIYQAFRRRMYDDEDVLFDDIM